MVRITNGANNVLVSYNAYINMFKPLGFELVVDDEDEFEEKPVVKNGTMDEVVVNATDNKKNKGKKSKK